MESISSCWSTRKPDTGYSPLAREDHYNVQAATDGWKRVLGFFRQHLDAP